MTSEQLDDLEQRVHLRVYYTKQGGHIHCKMYSAKAKNFTHAKNGTLVFDEEEWKTVFDMLSQIAEMIEEEGQ